MSKGRPSVKSNVWSKWPELGGKKRVKSHEIEKNVFVQFLLSSASNTSLRILNENKKPILNHFYLSN